MRWLTFITAVAVIVGGVDCVEHYRLQGHIPFHPNGNQLNGKEIKKLVNEELSTVYPDAVVSKIREIPKRSKSVDYVPSSMFVEVDVTMNSKISESIFDSKKVRFTSFKEIDSVRTTAADADPDCFNDGYMGPDGLCICPELYTGYNCKLLNCYNGGIPDYYLKVPQCFCPPGYNDFFCANRGCRPPVQDDINPPSTNLIVVMPATKTFNDTRQKIMNNFESLVYSLNPDETAPWLGLFVGVNYWATADYPDEIYTDMIITSDLSDFISEMATMNNLQINDNAENDQSLLNAIDSSLWDTFDGQVSGYPMVFGYTNSPNRRQPYLDDSFTLQANYWRAKVFINIINDNATPIDTKSDGFNDYHTYSIVTHSPVLYYSSDEIDLIHSTVLTSFHMPQYIDVRSQLSGTGAEVEAMRDYQDYNRTIHVLVTSNQPMNQGNLTLFTLSGNSIILPDTKGSYFVIYTLPETSWDGFRYTATSGSIFSFYTYTSSSETALWAGHDDSNTDMGDVINYAEAGYYFAVTPVAFEKPVIGIDYQSIDSRSAEIIYKARYLNPKPGCTLNYEFEKITHCTPGPFVHQVTLYTVYGSVTRVFPGYCAHSKTIPQTEGNLDELATTLETAQSTTAPVSPPVCPVEGTMVFADNRNHPFRDFIFAVEWSDNDLTYIIDVDAIIPVLLHAVYDVKLQQRFTFIIFNRNTVKTIVSHTRVEVFEQRITNLVTEEITKILQHQMNDTDSTSDSIDSVIMANLQTLNPKGQAFIFAQTTSGQQIRSNLLNIFPKSFQVNYFYHTNVYDSYPFSLYTRQTNGRWYSAKNPADVIDTFLPETVTSDLIFDDVYQDPLGDPFIYSFLVEKSATFVEVLLNGNIHNYTLLDSTGAVLHYNNSFDGHMGMIVADVSNRSTELFTLNVGCSYCTIQIRVASPLRVILGFTADLDDDTKYQTEPSAWLRMNLTARISATYVAARVTGLDPTESITDFKITAIMGSIKGPSFTANSEGYNNHMNSQMRLRNSTQCSYQWIGKIQSFYEGFSWSEELDGMKFLIKIKTDKGMEYTRMVYYYLPGELKSTVCPNGGSLDNWGVCQCTPDFTGELCTVPVCQNYGLQNFGACNCNPGYFGRFCEIVITEQYFPNITSTMVPTTIQTTTEPSTTMKATKTPVASTTRAVSSAAPITKVTKVATKISSTTSAVTMQSSTVTKSSITVEASTSQIYQSTPVTTVTTRVPTARPTTPQTKSAGSSLVYTVVVCVLLCIL